MRWQLHMVHIGSTVQSQPELALEFARPQVASTTTITLLINLAKSLSRNRDHKRLPPRTRTYGLDALRMMRTIWLTL